MLQPLAQRAHEGGDGDVAPVRRAHVPAARQREGVAQRGLVFVVQPSAGIERAAGELHLHLDQRPDLGETLGEQRHAASSTRRNAARTDPVSRS